MVDEDALALKVHDLFEHDGVLYRLITPAVRGRHAPTLVLFGWCTRFAAGDWGNKWSGDVSRCSLPPLDRINDPNWLPRRIHTMV